MPPDEPSTAHPGPADFTAERKLFEAALQLDADARERFLAELDEGRASRVRALLAAHLRPELSEPPFKTPTVASPDPEQIGPYRILERIGEGGMGVVYVAEQLEPVRRRVAIKLIKAWIYSEEVLGRFHSERQALALMKHPNIARILDADSTDDGRPYFVMEYVPGAPLLDYAEGRQLSIEGRLELFIGVCEAVQHAHQKGIIHRDLKPSNILVEELDGKATPKVIDFGVAKTLYRRPGDVVHTRLGGFVGTPGYVSPEQARCDVGPGETGRDDRERDDKGRDDRDRDDRDRDDRDRDDKELGAALDIDTRADVYSLGAVLYELLTGARPFDFRGAGLSEIQQTLAHKDPDPPSTRGPSARGPQAPENGSQPRLCSDLDWITLKSLERDRTRRYATSSELAADLRRYLAREPVLARPPSAAYRLGCFVRRHSLLIAVGGLAALALVTGTIGTTVGLVRARQEAERARVSAAIAQEVNAFLNEDLLAAVAPGQQGIDVSVREVLDTAAERVEGRFPNQPLVEASLRRTIGRTYSSLGVLADAEPHLLRARRLFEAEHGQDAAITRALSLELGTLYRGLGRLEDAEKALEPLFASDPDSKDPKSSPQATQSDPFPDELGQLALEELAVVRQRAGRFEEAERIFLRVLEGREALVGRDHASTQQVFSRLAVVYRYLERWHEAERLHREVVAFNRSHYGDEHLRTLDSISRFASLYLGWERFESAEELLKEALEPTRRVLGDEHPNTLILMNNLGWLYLKLERYGSAEQLLLETFELKKQTLGELHPSTLEGLQNLVILYEQSGDGQRHAEYLLSFADVLERVCAGGSARTEDRLEYAEVLLAPELGERRDPERALELALAATRATHHQDPKALALLARAYEATQQSPPQQIAQDRGASRP